MVVTANVAEVLPGVMKTEVGTLAELLLLESATVMPFGPAGPEIDTVPSPELPPTTVVGSTVTEESCAGETVRAADLAALPFPAVTVAEVVSLTAVVFAVKVAVVMPLGINTKGGTDTAELLLTNPTATPEAGACPLSVIVIVDEIPPVTVGGLAASALTERLLILI